ncbi:MAG: glycoside hydrolase family 16 protein [Solirubrobacterales bacterium]
MNPFPTARLLQLACLVVASTALAATSAAAASTPALKVTSPKPGVVAYGKIAVKGKLSSKRSARIVSAVFYLGGKKITTDRKYPFAIKHGVKFDTRNLPAAGKTLVLKVKYTVRLASGKKKTKTLSRKIKISLDDSGSVTGASCQRSQAISGLLLDEEFNECPLDTSIWSTQRTDKRAGTFPFYPFNFFEGAGYSSSPNNVSVAGGSANLTVTDDQIGTHAGPDVDEHLYPKSTGMINTFGRFAFKYGYVETKALVPKCSLCWPSFWLMPESDGWPPEVDVFEFINSLVEPYPYTTPHWAADSDPNDAPPLDTHFIPASGSNPSQAYTNYKPAGTGDLTGEWHTYGLKWSANQMDFYIDGTKRVTVDRAERIPQEPMYLIFMMAIGDPVIAAPYYPGATPSPAGSQMKIDYVRVWPLNDSPV